MMNGTVCDQVIFKTPMDLSYVTSNRYALIIISLLACLLVVFTISANVGVICVVLYSNTRGPGKNKLKNHQTGNITKWLMTSSAVLDVIIGGVSMPLGVLELVHNGRWTLGWEVCRIRLPLSFVFSGILAYHVMCLSVDRYLAVCKPFLYKRLPTRTAYVMIFLSWIVPIACVTIPVFSGIARLGVEHIIVCIEKHNICVTTYNIPALKTITSLIIYLPFIVTYTAYVFILLAVWRFNKRKNTFMAQGKPTRKNAQSPVLITPLAFHTINSEKDMHDSSISRTTTENSESQEQETNMFRAISQPTRAIVTKTSRNKKANLIVGSMIACYTISWLPTWVLGLVVSLEAHGVPYAWFLVCFWLASSNAALNPIVFCLNNSIKEALIQLFCLSKHNKKNKR